MANTASAREIGEERLGAWGLALVVLATAPLYLTLDHPFWGSETRWLFIAREMIASGDWLDPRLHGQPYADKPLLSYWAVTACAWLLGGTHEISARLPSVLAGTASVVLTAWMGARLLGRTPGIAAGWITATSWSFVQWSRTASADLLNLAVILAALAVYVQQLERPRRWQVPAFLALIALGGHVKGLPAVILPVAIVFADSLVARRWSWLRPISVTAAGVALAGVIYAAPFLISRLDRGDWLLTELAWQQNVVRTFAAFDHAAPVWYYVTIFPAMFLPWSLWLPGALAWVARIRTSRAGVRVVGIACAVIFALFTASESRRSYYILPLVPFAAMLVSGFWADLAARAASGSRLRAGDWLLGVAPAFLLSAAVLAVGILAFAPALAPGAVGDLLRELRGATWAGIGLAAAAVVAAVLHARRQIGRGQLALLAIMSALLLYFVTAVQDLRARISPEPAFARQMRPVVAGEPVAFLGGARDALRYYVGGDQTFQRTKEIAAALRFSGDDMLVACDENCIDRLPDDRYVTCLEVLRHEPPPGPAWLEGRSRFVLMRCVRR